jgi:hypothetical protein
MADAFGWARQRNIGGVGTSFGPSLAVFQNRLYAAWKGINNDSGIYWSSSDGRSWVGQSHIGGVGTSVGPSLCVFQNRLYAAWKGINNDQGLYWSSFDGNNWAPQQNFGPVGSSVGPSIAVFGNLLYAAWKGVSNDQGIWWSNLFDITTFNQSLAFSMQPQQQTQWCWSAVATSTSHFYNGASTWTQCTLANQQLGQTTCCVSGNSAACNKPWTLDTALGATGNLDGWQGGSVSQAVLEGDLVKTCPVGIRIAWSGGGAHFIIVDGATTSNSTVHVEDPIYGTSDIAYNTMATKYQGTGSWTHTYFTRP